LPNLLASCGERKNGYEGCNSLVESQDVLSVTITAWFAIAIYVAAPFLLLRLHRKWGAVAAIFGLWLPIEFHILSLAGAPAWASITAGMLAGVFAFRSRRDIFDVAAAFNVRRFSLREAAVNFALFAALGLPVAIVIGFIRLGFAVPDMRNIPTLIATIFLFNALPEEILFRGIIQHTIESATRNRIVAAALAALIFGAAHLNNGPPVPNYKYFLLSTLAGLLYGRAWRAHKNVLTPAVTHTMVNSVWRIFLR
jgi:membrane protease YdiL (CAAX protease family)